tara:strand:- start:622 stop:1503 length:882 start_codon:yes stop_codon:yes gene_type:complete
MFNYSICGFSVHSQIQIPILSEKIKSVNCDIKFLLNDQSNLFSNSLKKEELSFYNNSLIYKDKNGVVFKFDNTKNDQCVIINIYPNECDYAHIWESIINIPIGYALSSKSVNVVHGSSVAIKDSAACIFGFSGQGKSTLALSLVDKGFKFITEDLCIFKDENIYQFHSWIKTSKEIIEKYKIQIEDKILLANDSRERNLYKLSKKNCSEKSIPKIAYFLAEGEDRSINKISKTESFTFLLTNFYRFENEKKSDLNKMTEMLKSLDFYLYTRNINDSIEENSKFLSNHILSILS